MLAWEKFGVDNVGGWGGFTFPPLWRIFSINMLRKLAEWLPQLLIAQDKRDGWALSPSLNRWQGLGGLSGWGFFFFLGTLTGMNAEERGFPAVGFALHPELLQPPASETTA